QNRHDISIGGGGVKLFHSAAAALARQRLMNGNTGKPGGKRRLARKLIKVLVGPHVGILHYVFGLAVVAQDDPRDPIEPLVVTAHQNLKQGGLTGQHTGHYLFIAKFALCAYRSQRSTHLNSLHITIEWFQQQRLQFEFFFWSMRMRGFMAAMPCLFFILPAWAQWQSQMSGTDVQLRGISAVSDQIAWASGAKGTVLRTIDGGEHWAKVNVPDAEALDFRDVQAFDW